MRFKAAQLRQTFRVSNRPARPVQPNCPSALGGTRDPGDERMSTRNCQLMALNNGGDTVELLKGDGQVVNSLTYSGAQEGQRLDADGLR